LLSLDPPPPYVEFTSLDLMDAGLAWMVDQFQ
jgi:hypothetical protein